MAYRDEVLADSPVAYWRLEETSGSTLVDETGNGHDLSVVGDPDLTVSGKSNLGSAMDCDGIDDGATNSGLSTPSTSTVTFEAWVYQRANGFQRVLYNGNGGDANGFTPNDSDGFRFVVNDGAYQTISTPAVYDTWVHYVGVFDNGEMRLYKNASEVASLTISSTINSYTGIGVGISADGLDPPFDGIIDELAVYPTALSPTRVQAHFDAAQPAAEVVVLEAHSVLLKHRPQFDGRFSPHKILLNHFKAVPLQPHIVNLVHRSNDIEADTSEEGQAKALRKLLGYGWGVPNPSGSANEKIETPRESWPINRFGEAERLLRQEGVEEPTAEALGRALHRLGEDIQLDVRENLQRMEWHANAHTHPGLAGAEGTPVGPAEALFTISGGGTLSRRLTSNGSVFWSRGDNYGDLAVDPVERRVYAIGRSDTDSQYIDRVVSYDFDGVEQWNIDLHARIGDASETVWAFTLARDRSALYTIYNDGSQFGVVRIGTSDGSVSVIGKDTPSSTNFYPTATFDTDGDYLYFSDRAFHGGNRGRIIKFSLGDGHIVWEMSPDLANQHDCPLCATDTLLWAQKENGKVILVDKASGGIDSIVDLSGKDGAAGGNLWKDFHNTNSLYVLGTNFSVPDTWLYRLYPLGGVIQAEELKFLETIDMGRVIRDGEGNFFLGGGSGSTSHLMKLSPSLEVKWRIDGPSPRNFCTDQGRSVHWG